MNWLTVWSLNRLYAEGLIPNVLNFFYSGNKASIELAQSGWSSNGLVLSETLLEENTGGSIDQPELNFRTFYCLRPPTESENVLQRSDVIVIYDSNVFLSLCEYYDMAIGNKAMSTCQKRECGRLVACCNRSGCPNPSEGKGMRCRQSKRVNFTAGVRKKLLPPTSNLYTEIWTVAVKFHCFSLSDKSNFVLCPITSIHI